MWIQRVAGGVGVLAYAPDSKALFAHDGGGWVYAWDIATRARRKLLSLDYNERTRLYRDGLFTVGTDSEAASDASGAGRRATSIRLTPREANERANAAPIPSEAPAMTAHLP